MTTSTDNTPTAAPQLSSAIQSPLKIVGWLLTYRDGASEFMPGATRPSLYGPDCEEIAAVVLACDAEAYAQSTAARQRALCDDAWDAVETLQRVCACQAAHHRKQRQALEAELSQYQRSEFHPDWSLLQATQESLREKMAEIQRLRQELAGIRDIAHAAKQAVQLRLHIYMTTDSICARGRPRDVSIACRNTQEDAERAFCEAVTTWAAQRNDTATAGQRAAQLAAVDEFDAAYLDETEIIGAELAVMCIEAKDLSQWTDACDVVVKTVLKRLIAHNRAENHVSGANKKGATHG